ncbi:MAG: class I SAM-dependent methyltransferase [Cylindrospermopsis raciborskii]|uniref:class I SAM-dependent methyltransferase n=1 Tax=Cylindrospermopsis raciborskii TaxID=77022 RepID=UPI003D0C3B76
MKTFLKKILPFLDVLLVVLVYPAGYVLKCLRMAGVQRMPLSRMALLIMGVFPIRNHYYEPQFDYRDPKLDLSKDRNLCGINWNISGQIKFLEKLAFSHEILDIPAKKSASISFHFNNESFESGDAEYWYQIIRVLKPKRIIEVGSGYSTLMAIKATIKNQSEDSDYTCDHLCIEPYEMPWLETSGVSVIREKVENLELSFFDTLQENDILFIDSSHVIRPHGDVLFEYLQVLPSLNKGVVVHIHDIFSPKNYPSRFLKDEVKFWNEQYLLEAFLTHNDSWEVIGSLNYLHHNYYKNLKSVAPFLSPEREPGSFYIRKIV